MSRHSKKPRHEKLWVVKRWGKFSPAPWFVINTFAWSRRMARDSYLSDKKGRTWAQELVEERKSGGDLQIVKVLVDEIVMEFLAKTVTDRS